ncbi:MAG: AsmA family protein [Alphaproteobacteria bacterium]|nr:AsmA family protein [Alphaproteobacteria bacterium]
MRKLVRIAAAVVVLLVAGIAALFAFVASLDLDSYKPQIAAQVKAATGRDLEIRGRIAPRLGLSPSVSVEGVSLSNASWGDKRPMAAVERFEAKLQLVPLVASMGRRIVVDRIVLRGADVWLETDERGRANWKLEPSASAPAPASAPAQGRAGDPPAAPPQVAVLEVELERVRVSFKAGQAAPLVLALDKLAMRGDTPEGPRRIEGSGSYNRLGFQVSGLLGSVDALLKGPFPVDLALRSGDRAALRVSGTIRQPVAARDYEMTLGLDAREVARLGDIAAEAGVEGVSVPALGPLAVQLRLADSAPAGRPSIVALRVALGAEDALRVVVDGAVRDPLGLLQSPPVAPGANIAIDGKAADLAALARRMGSQAPMSGPFALAGRIADEGASMVALRDLRVDARGIDLAGDASFAFGGARPELRAALSAKSIDLAQFTGPAQAQPARPAPRAAPAPSDGRVIPDAALPFDMVGRMDIDIRLDAGSVVLPNARLEKLELRAAAKDGALAVRPMRFGLDGGSVALETTMVARDRSVSQKLDVSGLELGRVLQDRGLADWFRGGAISAKLDLRGSGRTLREVAGSLSGVVDVDMGPGTAGTAAQRLVGEWLASIAPALAQVQVGTSVRCLAYEIGFQGGVGTLRQGAIDTQLVSVRSAGTVDLRAEQLALRTQVGPLGFRTTGALAAPRNALDAAGTLQGVVEGAGGRAGGVASGVLGALGGGGGQRQAAGCGGQAAPGRAPQQEPQQQPASPQRPALPGILPNPLRR